MDLGQKGDPAAFEAFDEPHLPQRFGAVQRVGPQAGDEIFEFFATTGSGQRTVPDVEVQIGFVPRRTRPVRWRGPRRSTATAEFRKPLRQQIADALELKQGRRWGYISARYYMYQPGISANGNAESAGHARHVESVVVGASLAGFSQQPGRAAQRRCQCGESRCGVTAVRASR